MAKLDFEKVQETLHTLNEVAKDSPEQASSVDNTNIIAEGNGNIEKPAYISTETKKDPIESSSGKDYSSQSDKETTNSDNHGAENVNTEDKVSSKPDNPELDPAHEISLQKTLEETFTNVAKNLQHNNEELKSLSGVKDSIKGLEAEVEKLKGIILPKNGQDKEDAQLDKAKKEVADSTDETKKTGDVEDETEKGCDPKEPKEETKKGEDDEDKEDTKKSVDTDKETIRSLEAQIEELKGQIADLTEKSEKSDEVRMHELEAEKNKIKASKKEEDAKHDKETAEKADELAKVHEDMAKDTKDEDKDTKKSLPKGEATVADDTETTEKTVDNKPKVDVKATAQKTLTDLSSYQSAVLHRGTPEEAHNFSISKSMLNNAVTEEDLNNAVDLANKAIARF